MLMFYGLAFAQDVLAQTLVGLCDDLMGLVGPLAYLLVVFAALVYLAGQFGDAQMRAKSSVWAQSCIFGAIIGWAIITIIPYILAALLKASGVSMGTACSGIGTAGRPCSDIIQNQFCN